MREIKFRVLIKHPFKSLQRIVGFESVKAIDFTEQSITIKIDEEIYKFHFSEVEFIDYTGLKDKNDREIYEGDIVRVHEGEDFIWAEQVIENSGGYWVDENYLGAIHSFCEVIGNIYEHNHLLEESQNGTK